VKEPVRVSSYINRKKLHDKPAAILLRSFLFRRDPFMKKTSVGFNTGFSLPVLYISMHFSIKCGNHPSAFLVILLSLFLYLHPHCMLSFVHLVSNSMGTMHRLFHFTCVRQTFKRVDNESFLSNFIIITILPPPSEHKTRISPFLYKKQFQKIFSAGYL
jgi:hypothetical protein